MAYKYVQFRRFPASVALSLRASFPICGEWSVPQESSRLLSCSALEWILATPLNGELARRLCLSHVRISCSKTVGCPAGKVEILWLLTNFVLIGCGGKNSFRDICDRRCKCKNWKLVSCYRVRQDFKKMSLEERTRLIKAFKLLSSDPRYILKWLWEIRKAAYSSTRTEVFLPLAQMVCPGVRKSSSPDRLPDYNSLLGMD